MANSLPSYAPEVTFNLRYPGQQWDEETQLSYNVYRYYDGAVGGYTQMDPIGLAGGWNRRGYVGGNPLNGTDRLGLYESSPWLRAFVPGQVTFDHGMTAWENGNYGQAGLLFGAMLGEQALTVVGFRVPPVVVAPVVTRMAPGATETGAMCVADAALAAGKKSGAASELIVGNRVFTGVSGELVPQNPQVTAALMSTPIKARTPWLGGCSEIACIDKALNAGVNPAGGKINTVNIGISGGGHNTLKPVCPTCSYVIQHFGINQ